MARQPFGALLKRNVFGENARHFFERPRTDEALFDFELNLRDNFQLRFREDIESSRHGAGIGVFDGNDAVSALAAGNGIENFDESALGLQFHATAEVFAGGLMRESAFRPEIGNGQLHLQCDGSGNDFAINRPDVGLRNGDFGGKLFEFSQQFLFALGHENVFTVAHFIFADDLRARLAFAE